MICHTRSSWLPLLGVAILAFPIQASIEDEIEAREFMKELDIRYSHECNKEMIARWDYITDLEDEDKETEANEAAVHYFNFKKEAAINSSQYEYEDFSDLDLYRRFRFLTKCGPGVLDSDELEEYKDLQANMETIYGSATICDYNDDSRCDLTLEPDIESIMASSVDWDELKYVWEQWRENTGKVMRDDFVRFVELSNKAARLDGFHNAGDYWLNGYTVDKREAEVYNKGRTIDAHQFREIVSDVWDQVSDALYKKLHAYVRMKLQNVYPGKIDPKGPIPAHILGNMWAQSWTNIAEHVKPFPDMPSFDVTEKMVENGWDAEQMFETAEDFFLSIGLYNMTSEFWNNSIINQTEWGKVMVCHASAEDFCLGPEGNDYRIKMCTEVDMEDLVTVHHEMGHIEYFMAYKNLPHVYRDSANPGFHEAIGDLIALSVSTPKHLEEILDLTPTTQTSINNDKYTDEEKRDINFLMRMALEKIAFLPFGYLIDKYRWGLFDGSIPMNELNRGWWELRESLQGITPPDGVVRGEEYFDAGAKYHVPANVPYIRYFVSFIVQFQFHWRLCKMAVYDGPLHNCDIYGNEDIGDVLRTALQKGFSKPWPSVLVDLGGSEYIDPQPIIEYFDPLIKFIDQALEEADQCIGWGDDCDEPIVKPSLNEKMALEDMNRMDYEITLLMQTATEYDWTYYTNQSNITAAEANKAWANVSATFKEWYQRTIDFYEYETFKSEDLKRRFRLQKSLGISALPEEEYEKFNQAIKRMTNIYNEARVQDWNDDNISYGIDELEVIMARTKEEKALKYYWTEWRKNSGKFMKDSYKEYITLLNKAAKDEKNGFVDASEMWVDVYTEPTLNYTAENFTKEIEDTWNELKDFYQKLHAYVRYKLKDKYRDNITISEFIPAHLLGNMWAQSWENIYDIVAPYPEVPITDISTALNETIDDVREMVLIAEDFFTSLGLYNMTQDFWTNSVFEQNDENSVICHASAWDFFDIVDKPSEGRFRIKMCADKNQEDFIVIHHEMGHTQYQMSYSIPKGERPVVFRDGANPGFHEAIGDTIALYVSTPGHLKTIEDYLYSNRTGLPQVISYDYEMDYRDDDGSYEENINFLMKTALTKIAFIPYAYILDQWRWELFKDNNKDEDFNKRWWSLRLDVQGICPPNSRSASEDFDAGSKYHVADNVPYIRYFVAHILQFQFHHQLCAIAKGEEFDESQVLNCDIYNSTDAGDWLKQLLNMGSSVGWQEQLKMFLNSSDASMSSKAILDYFSPLVEYLDEYIKENSIEVGWNTGKVNDFMKDEEDYIPATVPIVVGIVLALMVIIVIVAYFVGQSRQKKKAKNSSKNQTNENVEIDLQNIDSR